MQPSADRFSDISIKCQENTTNKKRKCSFNAWKKYWSDLQLHSLLVAFYNLKEEIFHSEIICTNRFEFLQVLPDAKKYAIYA